MHRAEMFCADRAHPPLETIMVLCPSRAAAAAIAALVGCACSAQTIQGPFILTRGNSVLPDVEPSIQANPFNANDVVCVWKEHDPNGTGAPQNAQYAVTLDGFSTLPLPVRNLPTPNVAWPSGCSACFDASPLHYTDPNLAASNLDGGILLVAQYISVDANQVTGSALVVAHKSSGQGDLDQFSGGPVMVRYAVPCSSGNDRSALAIGPRPPGSSGNPEPDL
jgi:hypothetical protein